jgi:hypothetical protein
VNGLSIQTAVVVLEWATHEVTEKPWLAGDQGQAIADRAWFETALAHIDVGMAATDLVETALCRAAHVLNNLRVEAIKDCSLR